jgi:hypothetical protein
MTARTVKPIADVKEMKSPKLSRVAAMEPRMMENSSYFSEKR